MIWETTMQPRKLKSFSYSDEFKRLLGDKNKTEYLLTGLGFSPGFKFETMEDERFFISKAINKSGSILDIGCANGFLLRCLQEWCTHSLEPYGIEYKSKLIKKSREIFPSKINNFVKVDFFVLLANNFTELNDYGLPAKYDFIYWNVWDNIEKIPNFQGEIDTEVVRKVLGILKKGGRLILAFYNPKNGSNEKNKKKLKRLGYKFTGILEDSKSNIIAWIDK